MPVTFQECRMPDGSPTGRKMWRATEGDNYVAFFPVGRKGRFYVTYGLANGNAGGEQTDSREAAEIKAREILTRAAGI